MATTWIDVIGEQLRGLGSALWSEVRERGVGPLLEPVPPYNRSGLLSPMVTVGGVLGIMLFSGMAITAMGTLMLALLGLYLLFVQVFGLQFEFVPFATPGR